MLSLAQKFATLLDQNEFAEAAAILSPDCLYFVRDQVLRGPDQIVASYRSNYENGAKELDEIIFTSEVKPMDALRFRLCYLDRIRKGEHWHEHRCEQIVEFKNGKIVRIEHSDLPGEDESLQAFYQEVGLVQ